MKNYFINKKFVDIVLIVLLMLCFSACRDKKAEKVFLSETELQSETENDLNDTNNEKDSTKDVENESLEAKVSTDEVSGVIYVQVNGAVNNPGVYKLEKEMRVFEVIELAGGVTTEGATEAINMARPVTDEMVIYVPTKEEYLLGYLDETETVFEDYELDNSEKILININTASINELVTLTGIGEAKARLIIEYREKNGAFKDISEIMNISGIKQSAFEKIKDCITV